MALTAFYDDEATIPEELKEHYVPDSTGKFRLQLDTEWKSKTEIDGLSSALGKERIARAEFEKLARQFEGLDPVSARKALETLKNLDGDKVKTAEEIKRAVEATVAPIAQERDELAKEIEQIKTQYRETSKANAFANSAFLREHVIVSPQTIMTLLHNNIILTENGTVGFKDIYGADGELESFELGVQRALLAHPDGKQFLRAATSGSGAVTGTSATGTIPKSFTECKNDEERAKYLKAKCGEL